jgi:phosphoserine phosphatase
MTNPMDLFYAKVLQYFSYAGIKVINIHAQATFIFSATLYFYFLEVLKLTNIDFNMTTRIMVLLMCPAINLVTYYYFKNEQKAIKLNEITKNEDANHKIISNLLTAAFVLPMIVFFTFSIFI